MFSQNIRIQIQNRYENIKTQTVWSTLLPANSGRHGSQLFFYLQRNELSWKTKSRERNYSRVIPEWTKWKCMFPFKEFFINLRFKTSESVCISWFVISNVICIRLSHLWFWSVIITWLYILEEFWSHLLLLSQILFNSWKDSFYISLDFSETKYRKMSKSKWAFNLNKSWLD